MRVFVEASGSVASGFIIRALQQSGHEVIASDINSENAGSLIADDYIQLPLVSDSNLWQSVLKTVELHRVQIVIPSLDDMLLGWDAHRSQLERLGVVLILSPKETLVVCLDKWLTYQFFIANDIPTPANSLSADYALFKPRMGRGAKGILYAPNQADRVQDMSGLLSQDYLEGEEYTIDVLCDDAGSPVYILPRRRILVVNGKAVNAQVVYDNAMIAWVKVICSKLPFIGAINIQCFKLADGRILFIEINPRLASGMALSFAASANWFEQMIAHYVQQQPLIAHQVQWGMTMYRHYTEVFSQ